MKNMNVRYECLDARDDYSAPRKNMKNDGIFPQWTTNGVLADLDEDLLYSGEGFKIEKHIIDGEHDKIGDKREMVIQQMLDMNNIMRNCGWMNESIDGLPSIDLSLIQPDVLQNANKWDAAVQAKWQDYLDEKNCHMPNQSVSKKRSNDSLLANDVKIINKSFLQKISKHKDKVVNDVGIVANNATSLNVERLSMYLGRMGGIGKSKVIEALVHLFSLRNEKHQFMILAPTGSATALLNGSTYHSALGINDRSSGSAKKIGTTLK
jgi:hypothetical protein